jgi:hypothetical protein
LSQQAYAEDSARYSISGVATGLWRVHTRYTSRGPPTGRWLQKLITERNVDIARGLHQLAVRRDKL